MKSLTQTAISVIRREMRGMSVTRLFLTADRLLKLKNEADRMARQKANASLKRYLRKVVRRP